MKLITDFFKNKNKNYENLPTFKYPWKRDSRENLTRYTLFSKEENPILSELRNEELRNPAPFSNQTLITLDSVFEKPIGFKMTEPRSKFKEFNSVDIPITKIIGLEITNNLDNYKEGMTFREVLFECLHGDGITQASIDFLTGSESKNLTLPHTRNKENPKSNSRGPLKITKYGEWYIVENGQQRAIIAMYAIWQKYGNNGTLKNVSINSLVE